VRDRLDEFSPAPEVVVVTFTDPTALEAYLRGNDLPFPVLLDADRAAYRAYGLGRARVWRAWGLRSIVATLRIALRGRWPRRPFEDTLQLGGDFVIGADGTLVHGHWSEGPDDRPTVDELIVAVAAAG